LWNQIVTIDGGNALDCALKETAMEMLQSHTFGGSFLHKLCSQKMKTKIRILDANAVLHN
jgi:hypothetical protein